MGVVADHLASMRAEWLAAARETVVITTPVEESDGEGGKRDTGAVVTSSVLPCSKGPVGIATNTQGVLNERENAEALTVIYLPHDAEVTTRSTLVLNGIERFRAVEVVPRRSYQVKRRVYARYAGLVETSES